MRILVAHSRYASANVSGENRVVEDDASLLREAGHDVSLIEIEPPASRVSAARAAARAVWGRAAASEIRRRVEAGAEIVHFHNLFPSISPAAIAAARRAGAATVMTLHNYRLLCLPATFVRDGVVCEACLGRSVARGVVGRCYRGSAAASAALATSLTLHRLARTFDDVGCFIAVSEFVRRKHLEAGFPPDRIVVRPNVAARLNPVEPTDELLMLGRLVAEKGIRTVVDAARRSGRSVTFVGAGPLAGEIREAAASGAPVRHVGAVGSGEARELVARAQALVVASESYEGAPRTIAEAAAAGVPTIATRIGSLPEFVRDGETGLLVDRGDAAALADAFRRIQEPRLRAALAAGALRLWEQLFSPAVGLASLEHAYEHALARRAARRPTSHSASRYTDDGGAAVAENE